MALERPMQGSPCTDSISRHSVGECHAAAGTTPDAVRQVICGARQSYSIQYNVLKSIQTPTERGI